MRFVSLALALILAAVSQAQLPRKGWLGAQLQPASDGKGITIVSLLPGGTAESGLRAGDVLLKLGDAEVTTPQSVGAVFASAKVGEGLQAVVRREGKEQRISLSVKEKPRDRGEGYEVIYDDVVSHGHRIRTMISKPKAAGKRPVIFLIQGIGYVSQDNPLSGPGSYSRILKRFSDKGFVTVRVDKPGLGDSEGGPPNTVDYERDLDGFRQAMKAVFSGKYDFIDRDNVFIFGHSMGGCEGPIIASEFPVKGLAVYGTVTRTWEEYCIQNIRRQAILGGAPYEKLDQDIRKFMAAQSLMMTAGLEPAEIKTKFPDLAPGVDLFTPDGKTMSGMPMPFWRQCFRYNYAEYWAKLTCKVLSMWGENEFIASYEDHPLIAEIVNSKHPGNAEYKLVPESDHGFKKTTSMRDSFVNWGKPGEMNPTVIGMLEQWVDAVMKAAG